MSDLITFTNARLCRHGQLVKGEDLTISTTTGLIVDSPSNQSAKTIDLDNAIIAPGYLELQTNGVRGFHFTHFNDEKSYAAKLEEVAKYLPQTGCTGFYPTIPTVHSDEFKKV
jgi:N-acetylglucosamine-6-phosphate deacetylase